jgi:hypothetical protein
MVVWAVCVSEYVSSAGWSDGADKTGMDAIDGKQARRVGMASALGEMFDHGCGEFPECRQ